MTKETTYLIWTSQPDFDDVKDDLAADNPDYTEDELYQLMIENNNMQYEDELANIGNIIYENGIIIIADLGLWWGRPVGYKEIESGKLRDCLKSEYEPTWFVDKYGDLRCDDMHHDGTNHYLYREWKPDITEEEKDEFKNKLYIGKATEDDIQHYTRRMGDPIGKVYGWTFS